MSYRLKHEFDRIEYILHLEREVDRLSHWMNDESGNGVLMEIHDLESEVEHLRALLSKKDEAIALAQSGSGVAELRSENARLRAEIARLQGDVVQARAAHATENEGLRRQVSALMAVAQTRRTTLVKVETRDVAAAWIEPESDRGRWAGLELD